MTVNEFFRNILGLEEQVVVYFELDIRNRILNLWVKPYKMVTVARNIVDAAE
jgi:hypothetical protein